MVDDVEVARALHVLSVVHWIGGVAMVTLVALPLARAAPTPAAGWALFESIENRFAAQVRWSIPLAGLSGLWMAWRGDLWSRFRDPAFWWMDAMVLLWAVFATVVFAVEPFAHRVIEARAARDPAALLRRLQRLHAVLLAASAVTVAGAVAGARGGFFS